jgi:DNA-binding PucR family transcriptional regulator
MDLLTPVLALPDNAALLDTLQAYLDNSFSLVNTARHLRIHRNTVRQRITAVEDALGRRVSSDTLALRLACLAINNRRGKSQHDVSPERTR